MENYMINFNVIADQRGKLISLEQKKNIPFDIKRVYYLYDLQSDLPRGFHAHKDLQQVLVCIKGSCRIILDNGITKSEYILNSHQNGLFVNRMIWREMHEFSDDAILMVLASEIYDENDYIRNYEDFLEGFSRKEKSFFSHEKSIVESINIGSETKIWAFTHVFPKAVIGKNCNINDHTLIENDVVIGDNVTVKSGVHIWDGVRIGNNVFIGPSVVFTNDLNPRSKRYPGKLERTFVDDYASIGANSTIIAGNRIGKFAMIGAGSVVTKDVPDYSLWYGNPAELIGYVCECGKKLNHEKKCYHCNNDYSRLIK